MNHEQWVKRQKRIKIVKIAGAGLILLFTSILTCQPAHGQDAERGKTISAGREKKRSFYYIVCIESQSGKRYSIKYNVHCWTCAANIPQVWDIVKSRRIFYIKPVR